MNYLLTPDELLDLEEQNNRLIEGPRGLRLYVEDAWHIVEPAQQFVGNWHIDAICDHLQAVSDGYIQDLIITVPPRHSKSLTVAVMWPTWEWGPRNLPHFRWLFSAYAQSLSLRDSQKRRRIMASRWYQSRWGHKFNIGGTSFMSDGTAKYENNYTGYHLATSVKGSNTGEGGDRIVVDDPINVKEVTSDLIRTSVNDWWDVVMSTRRNNPKKSARVIIMQRTHERDLVGHVLEKPDGGGYVVLSLPTEYEGKKSTTIIGFTDPREVIGELLNPERFGPKEVAQAKVDLGQYGYSAQHQQNPAPAEGGIIKKHWFKFWAPIGHPMVGQRYHLDGTLRIPGFTGAEVVALPRGFDEKAQSWDMNFGSDRQTDVDPCVGQYWGKIDGLDGFAAQAFLLDQCKGKWEFTEALEEMVGFIRRNPSALKLIEAKANGPAIISSLRHRISGIVGFYPEDDKKGRLRACAPVIEAGGIYLPLPTMPGYDWVLAYVKEVCTFPNAANDDQVDATTQLMLRWFNVQQFTSSMFAKIDI
jgi:predicted phage terminase large subunit-like protein